MNQKTSKPFTVTILSLSLLTVMAGLLSFYFAPEEQDKLMGNGLGIPFIISSVSMKAGKSAATTVMPLISMAK